MRPYAFRILALPNLTRLLESYDAGLTGLPLDARHPLLDVRVVEYLLKLPPVPWCVSKEVIRVAMRGRLPAEVLSRPKTPLAGDLAVAKAREHAVGMVNDFKPCPELGRYVNEAAIPAISTDASSQELWMNLRPTALNLWLSARQTITFGGAI